MFLWLQHMVRIITTGSGKVKYHLHVWVCGQNGLFMNRIQLDLSQTFPSKATMLSHHFSFSHK